MMTDILRVLDIFDERSELASPRGSRTCASYQGSDGAWHRSRLVSFVSHANNGEIDGDCRMGPGQMDTMLTKMGMDVSPFKIGAEHASSRSRKRRELDAAVKGPLAKIAAFPKTCRQAMKFVSAGRNHHELLHLASLPRTGWSSQTRLAASVGWCLLSMTNCHPLLRCKLFSRR